MPRAMPDIADLAPLDGVPLRFAWEFVVVGVRYGQRAAACQHLNVGDVVDLVREPDNTHDRNAIRVEHEGRMLGYVPREFACAWAPALDAGATTLGTVLATTRKNTVGEDMAMPLVWMRLYSHEQRYELCDIGYQPPIRDFDGGWFYPAEHCFYVPDDDPSGRHRKGNVIVSADEKVVVGLPPDTEPPAVLVIPEGVREVAPWACADSGADGVLLPSSLEAIHMFAFAGAGGWLVRIPAGVRHVSPGAFCASPILGDGWRPLYFEVDGANERLFAQGGSLIERVGEDRRLLYLYVDAPAPEHDCPDVRSCGLDDRVPGGVTVLGDYSLVRCPLLWSHHRLLLPDSLRRIEPRALDLFRGIEGVSVPESLEFGDDEKDLSLDSFMWLFGIEPADHARFAGDYVMPSHTRYLTSDRAKDHTLLVYSAEGDVVCPPPTGAKRGGARWTR